MGVRDVGGLLALHVDDEPLGDAPAQPLPAQEGDALLVVGAVGAELPQAAEQLEAPVGVGQPADVEPVDDPLDAEADHEQDDEERGVAEVVLEEVFHGSALAHERRHVLSISARRMPSFWIAPGWRARRRHSTSAR